MLTGHRWKIATVRGIPLYVSTSWVWIAALYIWSQYNDLTITRTACRRRVRGGVAGGPRGRLFFSSILAHETAHAVMARVLDLPVRGVTLVFWGGATETRADLRGPLGEFLVAFVGPATTLALAGVFWVAHIATEGVISEIVGYLSWLSLIFAGLNALPGFPLDGGRMLLAGGVGTHEGPSDWRLRVAGMVRRPGRSRVRRGRGLVRSATASSAMGLFTGYIALILITTGRGMDQRIAVRDRLMQGRVADAMRPPPPTIPSR